MLLTLTIPFTGFYVLGFKIIGDAGLFLTLMTVCFSLVPIKPLVGKAVFDYRKDVSLATLSIAVILFHGCAFHSLPNVIYLLTGIGSTILAAITLSQLRKTHKEQIDS